ncbi:hypothetical protein HZH68_013615 [Vespula germanica]|uniref:Uncharacterized protein n=1 Tax=Vespula germanica TaxID=30212 RepID=A0A834JE10_VESGE|nr:hypothetical protein HZH68_013615 [Vespula germanica]
MLTVNGITLSGIIKGFHTFSVDTNVSVGLKSKYNLVLFYQGLFEWWKEGTEYLFQRIQTWAALTRGYNRLRSKRFVEGRSDLIRVTWIKAEFSVKQGNISSYERIFYREIFLDRNNNNNNNNDDDGDGDGDDNDDDDDDDEDGVDEDGVDEDGVDEDGVDEDGVDEDGVDEDGVDEDGVDENGDDEDDDDEDDDDDENGDDENGDDENGDDEDDEDDDDDDDNDNNNDNLDRICFKSID